MPSVHAIYVMLMTRALVYIALISAALLWGTGNNRVVAAYGAAHVAALAGGAAVDLAVYKLVFHGVMSVRLMEYIFAAPVFLFMAISWYLCDRTEPVHLKDVLLTLAAIVGWGCAVIWGPQTMDGLDVLGAWFVAAGAGAIDLYSLHGPAWARERRYATRVAGYAATLVLVYLALPRL